MDNDERVAGIIFLIVVTLFMVFVSMGDHNSKSEDYIKAETMGLCYELGYSNCRVK